MKLKKIFSGLLAGTMLFSGINVFASTSMEMEWYGDYSENQSPKLVVEFTSPASYVQQVTAVIYPSGVTSPTVSNYIRVSEVTVNGSKKKTITFKITDAFNASDNKYKVVLNGSGYMSAQSTAETEVNLLTKGGVSSLLQRLNAASTSSAMMSAADDAIEPLQLTAEDISRREKRGNVLIAVRTNDYAGAFGTLKDVKHAWAASDVIAALTDNSGNASDDENNFKNKLETNAAEVGLDTEDADYKANARALAKALIGGANAYNDGNGVNSISSLKKMYSQYLGMIVMNNANKDNAYQSFEKYKSFYTFDSEMLKKYDAFESDTKEMVAGQLYNKSFTLPSELVNKFNETVKAINMTPSNTPSNTTGNNNNSSISGGIGGSISPTAPSVNGYSDVTSSHWAYSYISELSSKNIISGYDDNTFRPNNNVTREEFVKMIINGVGMYKESAECDFADVPKSAWYYKYVASAYENEIVSGITDDMFGIGSNITRQDVAVIAARILEKFGKAETAGSVSLTDIDNVSDYAKESVSMLNSMGIINGFDDGSFMPHNSLTRAEAAAIISKLISKI